MHSISIVASEDGVEPSEVLALFQFSTNELDNAIPFNDDDERPTAGSTSMTLDEGVNYIRAAARTNIFIYRAKRYIWGLANVFRQFPEPNKTISLVRTWNGVETHADIRLIRPP
jgi:hypothetical protein